jgi:hypothetical protein
VCLVCALVLAALVFAGCYFFGGAQ